MIDVALPDIEKSNEAVPIFGRLVREPVVVTKESKPTARAGGGCGTKGRGAFSSARMRLARLVAVWRSEASFR